MSVKSTDLLALEPAQLYDRALAALQGGQPADARKFLLAAASRMPSDHEVRYLLYSALEAEGEDAFAGLALIDAMHLHAEEFIRRVIGSDVLDQCRQTAAGMEELGLLLYKKNQMGLASYCFREALAIDADQPRIWLSLGLTLQHQARIEEAEAVFRNIVKRWPDNASAHCYLNYALFFGVRGRMELTEEAVRWNEMHAAKRMPATPDHANDRNPDRRLKIGYFSPIFTNHQLTQFFEPVLANHDHEQVEVFCYSAADNPADPAQQRLSAFIDHWRPVSRATDIELAQMIKNDGIDILVDLWGHTTGNRLTAFAFHPAPIQMSYLNYAVTTGMDAMDYVIHPKPFETPGEDKYFTEKVLHVGDILAPFRPLDGVLPAGPTPALESGRVTFGSFNHPAKVNDEVVALWARILKAVPDSRLLFRYRYFEDLIVQRSFRARFQAHGVDPERLEFGAYLSGLDFINSYRELDIALDTFPYQGGTTTVDALTAGVPVLSCEGDWFRERVTPTNLRACGLDELVASSYDAYVDLAVELANDLPRLDAIRQRVRPALDASPLRDEEAYTRTLEAAYRDVFETWCETADQGAVKLKQSAG